MAPEVLAGALKARRLFLFLDYDGTLMPFSGDPGRVVPDGELLGLLAALLQKPGWKVGIVSGRALEDLRRLFPVSGFFLVGSHGAEIQDGQGQVLRSDDPAEFRRLLGGIREALKDVDLGEGVLLEEKPYALALHYRQAPEGLPSESLDAFRRACQPAVERGILQWLWGDQVVEVRTARAHKGTAVDQILAQQPPGVHPVYLGDDATDEDAFRALQGRGTTVRVGAEDRATQARYQFRNVSEVRRFLKAVVD
ncbi:MAG: trehalose-phosphatase [Acidobacteria bacterium]|nr:trehalose-phosphatase [Acidobacteriota bacterium]